MSQFSIGVKYFYEGITDIMSVTYNPENDVVADRVLDRIASKARKDSENSAEICTLQEFTTSLLKLSQVAKLEEGCQCLVGEGGSNRKSIKNYDSRHQCT